MPPMPSPTCIRISLAAAFAIAFTSPSSVSGQETSRDWSIEEIVVVAEKRKESVQDVSQAVTAISAEGLDDKNILSFVDLASIAPGVTIAKNEGFKTVIAIRGIGNEANQNAIANPSVSYHLDGVYIASPFALQTDFLDLERIEVLRGPQGTLFGQNSTGGAINVITATPEVEAFSGKADVTVGTFDLVRLRGAVNVPLGETSALRASLSYFTHEGYSDNVVNGQDLDDANNFSGRLRWMWQPTEDFSLNLTAQYFREDSNGRAIKGILDPTGGARRLAQDSRAEYELDSQVYSLIAQWDLDAFTVRSLTSYQKDDITIRRDNDRHDLASLPPFALLPSFYDPEENEQETFTQEVNLISAEPLFGKIDWIAGVFYMDTEVDILIRERIDFNFDGTFDPIDVAQVLAFGGEVGFISDSNPVRESLSVYGQTTYHFTDQFRLILGARYTDDEVESEVTNFFGRAGTEFLETSSSELTGRVALEFDVSEGVLLFASVTRGFKPGGSNLTFGRESVIAPAIVLQTFEDEKINAYELGLKADWLDGRMRTNLAAFWYDYKNLQFQATDPEVFQGGVGNVPEAEVYGAELELLALLTEALTLDLKVSYLHSEISDSFLALDNVASDAATNALVAGGTSLFSPAVEQARAAAITDVRGNELAKTPSFTADVSLRYERPVGDRGDFRGTLQYVRRGSFEQRIFNNPLTDDVPSYDVVNLVLSFDIAGGAWGIDLLGLNLGDEDGVNSRMTDVFGVGATGEELIPPRQVQARLRVRF